MNFKPFFLLILLFSIACANNLSENAEANKSSTSELTEIATIVQKKEQEIEESIPKKTKSKSNKVPRGSKKAAPKAKSKKRTVVVEEIEPYVEYETPLYIPDQIPESEYPRIFAANPTFVTDGFDFPVGKPDAVGYYKSQNFGDRLHLGEDWNGKGGGDTDFGDPVFCTANGLVTFVDDICCGWGNTIRVIHYMPHNPTQPYVESLYSHLHTMQVKVGDLVQRGEQVGTIGSARGLYVAHLHFEMRDFINMTIGPGYSDDQMGYLDPTPFIRVNRPF